MATELDAAYILFGLKHAGTTTLGRMLAERLDCPFVDIDAIIEKQTGFTTHEIYLDYGPDKVMNAQYQYCKALAEKCVGQKIVITAGGNMCDNAPALALLRELGTFVFVAVPEQVILKRIFKKASTREDGTFYDLPLYLAKKNVKTEEDVKKVFGNFYRERTATYRAFTDISVSLGDAPPEENFKILCEKLSV